MELNITVKTADLLGVVRDNKDKHQLQFEKAWEMYVDATREWLEDCLKRIKKGKSVERMSPHPVPEDHTGDYEQVIGMLGMHANDTIDLDWMTYRNFVDDEWSWSRAFETTNTYYASRA